METLKPMESKNERTSFSYREGDTNYELTVYSISNGFILETYKSWYEGEGDKKEYKSSTDKTYFKENPLNTIKKEKIKEPTKAESTLSGLKSALDKMAAVKGMVKI